MTVRTRTQLNSDADTALADNTTGDISPSDIRTRVKDLADSALLAEDIGEDVQAYDAQLSSLVRQNLQNADYTLVAEDSGKHIYRSTADSTARAWTIPSNASVPFQVGTIVTFDNDGTAGAVTIAITSDTMSLVGLGRLTGSRTLAVGGQATAVKVASTRWRISGTGLT